MAIPSRNTLPPLDVPDSPKKGCRNALGRLLPPANLRNELSADTQSFRDPAIKAPIKDGTPQKRRASLLVDIGSHKLTELYSRVIRLSTEKSGAQFEPSPEREWVSRIKELREFLKIDQKQLADRIGVSQASVSKWESGQNEPTAQFYAALTRLAEDNRHLYDFFREQAFKKMPPDVAKIFQSAIVPTPASSVSFTGETIEIPLVKDPSPVPLLPSFRTENIERLIPTPGVMIPNPDFTFMMRARGTEMSPIIENDFIVVIDVFERDQDKLVDKMIACKDPRGAVRIVWLRKVGEEFILMAQNAISSDLPALLKRESNWRVVGRVLWWIGVPQGG